MLEIPKYADAGGMSMEDSTIAPAVVARDAVVSIDSGRLLDGQREVLIRHGNECYRLRHTRNDKLILTK